MKKQTKLLISTITLILVLTGAVMLTNGTALANGFMGGDNKDEMTQQLAEKLNVSEDQVSSAMDQIREEHQAERVAEVNANLDKAVTDGVITQEQKQQILDKQAEHRAQAEKQRGEMRQWAEDSGIDFDRLRDYGIGGRGMGGGRGMHGGGYGMGM